METKWEHGTPTLPQKFLPYLWGMETPHSEPPQKHHHRSYRTYEEWKPHDRDVLPNGQLSSYRTYEEWKRGTTDNLKESSPSSYRTYEEWKLWR